jgi:adenylate cyclase
MPSLLPGYEYDIFISYRHNDNLDGWVTDFVQNLEKELRGTIKESVTIYFDKNPHDGLLETHHVDKSLEGKLKCLIFIPIISQTYCDRKSFAWQNEFVAFNKLAKEDQLGRDIKLSNGNVASRILPVKIHELDTEDKTTIESEIGGVLRAIDFIYKEAGVNRPLKSTDSKNDNQNKTDYRNQVNKVANAIKEILTSLKNPGSQPARTITSHPSNTKTNKKPLIAILSLILLFAVAGFFLYPKLLRVTLPTLTLDKSIAVLPFVDLSEAKDQGWFGDGLTEEILNSLAHVKELRVTSRTSSFAFKNKNLRIQTIADSLGVNYVVEGSVRKVGEGLRITAQLIRAKDDVHIWSNTYDRNSKDIFLLQQDIASSIARSLNISLDSKSIEQMQWAGTQNADAYIAFLKARELDEEAHRGGRFIDLVKLKKANVFYEESSTYDPDFVNPYLYHADFFLHYMLEDDPHYQDTITEKQAYKLFMTDLSSMVARSKDEHQRNYYRLHQIMYSNDWSNFRNEIEKCIYRPDAVKYFTYSNFDLRSIIILLGYGDQMFDISKKILDQDPSDIYAKAEIALSLINAGNYDQALQEISKFGRGPNDNIISVYRLYSMLQLDKLDEVYELVSKEEDLEFSAYYDVKAMILAKKGFIDEAKEIFKIPHRQSPFYLLAVDAVFGRQASNEAAKLMDQKILLDFPLFRGYVLSPTNLPFDLSATPNFARRLRQAGVALK